MPPMRLLLAAALAALAGCGDDEREAMAPTAAQPARPAAETRTATTERAPPRRQAPRGKTITLGDSEFGSMLFDARRQAIYVFQRDRRDLSRCYGECARAWPPVYTKGRPRAGRGVRQSLLSTTRRRDGRRQVTYAGRPLYFYVNEGPGEVRCHNVNLNGGLWWVVGPNGRRRP
jgi:predicted lipoprotein with Yx(FWY)xxD motif